jgi:glutamine amidotransferase
MGKIVILDGGVGNFSNVQKAVDGIISNKVEDIKKADKLIFPGVGSFGAVSKSIIPLKDYILEHIDKGKPFLGICLGMQLLFQSSEEDSGKGLAYLPGKVVKFKNMKVPHIGWNDIEIVEKSVIFKGIQSGSYFYFVHSYYVVTEDKYITSYTEYESRGKLCRFVSSVQKDNVFGVQFHPEKSSNNGIKLLENFKSL